MWHINFAIWAYVLMLVYNVAMVRSLVNLANIDSRKKVALKGFKCAMFWMLLRCYYTLLTGENDDACNTLYTFYNMPRQVNGSVKRVTGLINDGHSPRWRTSLCHTSRLSRR